MQREFNRRTLYLIMFLIVICLLHNCTRTNQTKATFSKRAYNGSYFGSYLNRVAFPIGGIGAGMICLEGTGALSHVSIRNQPDIFNEPCMFAAVYVNGCKNGAKVLEGPVPNWKVFGNPGTANGAFGTSFGLPRFNEARFLARFPFANVMLEDDNIPLEVEITGWSPFIPGDADNSSLPVGALEYRFKNTTSTSKEAVFSFNSRNSIKFRELGHTVKPIKNGFVIWHDGTKDQPQNPAAFAVFVDDNNTVVDHCWFRGGWFDPLTITWKNIQEGILRDNPPVDSGSPGASLFVPFSLQAGEEKIIRLMLAWYVPKTDIRFGKDPDSEQTKKKSESSNLSSASTHNDCSGLGCSSDSYYHIPWYAGRFSDIKKVVKYWVSNYDELRRKSAIFRDTFYDTTLPDEVIEAIAANLTILKSPTILRQCDGRLWCWEGCTDSHGCCAGSCTHVWNYAQAIPHLFPELERSLRQTEFNESQDERGHQVFRSAIPIRPIQHLFHSAADGQLGGIMKVHREWRISGDTEWLKAIWPNVKLSLDYCIKTWDPKGKGILEEPHHNTYDIEFWGPDGMCTSFYLGALTSAIKMGAALDENITHYKELLEKGCNYVEKELFDGEYFFQRIQWKGLETPDPVEASKGSWNLNYSLEAQKLLEEEGPKYQYGTGCLSDGILGLWIARMCGMGEIIDQEKVRSHLKAVYKYNLKYDLSNHANPQRPSFALGKDGGLLLCTWPKGGALSLPFIYSNEVWTGIEYQVASHLMLEDMVKEGLDIVRVCRDRYDGTVRNPFNEYECGHWYARAMSSYGLLQGLTGVRYDAVDKTLYIDSHIGNDFRSFFSTETGFGTVGLKKGKPFVDWKTGDIDIEHIFVSGEEINL